jgi:hypothetical protein
MMAIADGARPDDKAKMVWSGECMAYLSDTRRTGNKNSQRPVPPSHIALQYTATWPAAIHCASHNFAGS